jgi:hypothetical protein
MTALKFSSSDFVGLEPLVESMKRIDDNDLQYIDPLMDEIGVHQPFMASIMLGFNLDLPEDETEEMIRIYLMIWAWFKNQPGCLEKAFSQKRFEAISRRNMEFLHYLTGEQDHKESFRNVVAIDLEKLKSKALFSTVLYRFETRPVLSAMKIREKGLLLLGIKSLIECLDELPD